MGTLVQWVTINNQIKFHIVKSNCKEMAVIINVVNFRSKSKIQSNNVGK